MAACVREGPAVNGHCLKGPLLGMDTCVQMSSSVTTRSGPGHKAGLCASEVCASEPPEVLFKPLRWRRSPKRVHDVPIGAGLGLGSSCAESASCRHLVVWEAFRLYSQCRRVASMATQGGIHGNPAWDWCACQCVTLLPGKCQCSLL